MNETYESIQTRQQYLRKRQAWFHTAKLVRMFFTRALYALLLFGAVIVFWAALITAGEIMMMKMMMKAFNPFGK